MKEEDRTILRRKRLDKGGVVHLSQKILKKKVNLKLKKLAIRVELSLLIIQNIEKKLPKYCKLGGEKERKYIKEIKENLDKLPKYKVCEEVSSHVNIYIM